jgi:hypothetical protein
LEHHSKLRRSTSKPMASTGQTAGISEITP